MAPEKQPEPRVIPHRLTIVGTLYHQGPDTDPTAIELKYSKDLATPEQVYMRRGKVAPNAWMQLDNGWLPSISHTSAVVVTNHGTKLPTLIPTKEEQLVMGNAYILVSTQPDDAHTFARVPVNFSMVLPPPIKGTYLYIKAESVQVNYTLVLVPN